MTDSQEQLRQYLKEQELNLSDLIEILLRRRRVFAVTFLTIFVIAILYTFGMQPVYQASSTLYVQPDKQSMLGFGDSQMAFPWSSNTVDAELEIIKSRTIGEKVVGKMHLDWSIEKSESKSICKIIDIDAPEAVKELTLTLTGPGSYKVIDADGRKLGQGSSGAPFSAKELQFTVKVQGEKGDSFTLTRIPWYSAAAGVSGGAVVEEVGKMTNVISVSYMDTDPERARDIVNAIVQAYLDQSLEFKSQEAGKTVSFIEEQLANIKQELSRSELNLQEYKSSSGVVQLDAEASELIRKYSNLEQQRVGIELSKKQFEFALAAQRESQTKSTPYSPAVMKEDPLIAEMARKLAELEVQKRSLMTEYTASHPAVQNVQEQIDEIQKKIRSTYQTGFNNLAKQEADIRQRLAAYEEELREMPVEERELARYTRLAKVTGDIYTFLLQKHEEARIAKASTISNINVIDTAITPEFPVKPQKVKYLVIGFMLSTMAAFGLVLLIDFLDDSVKNENQAKNALRLTHLATIPYIGFNKGDEDEDKSSLTLITHSDQRSIAAEAFRALRTALHYSDVSRNRKITVLTSSFSGEGKSTIASNLAVTYALTGAKTLIIDADLHKSTLYERFGLKKVPGITEVLAGDSDLRQALQSTGIDNLTFMSTGTIPPNPSVLIGSSQMRVLVEKLREEFDQIVIDAPPTLLVADAVSLTTFSDSVLVVLEAGRVPVKAASRLGETLRNANAPVAGFVFNNRTLKGHGYGYGGYGYGGYGYGGYGYGGYGYGYGQEKKGQSKLMRNFPILNKVVSLWKSTSTKKRKA